jgi:hypothetical protein
VSAWWCTGASAGHIGSRIESCRTERGPSGALRRTFMSRMTLSRSALLGIVRVCTHAPPITALRSTITDQVVARAVSRIPDGELDAPATKGRDE